MDVVKRIIQSNTRLGTTNKSSIVIPDFSGVPSNRKVDQELGTYKYLGYVSTSTSLSSYTSIDLAIPAGTCKKGDVIHFVGDGQGVEFYINLLITDADSNTMTFSSALTASSISTVPLSFMGHLRAMPNSIGTDITLTRAVMHAAACGVATSGSHRIASATLKDNWMTDAFTISLRLQANAINRAYATLRVYLMRGEDGFTCVDGEL